MTKQERTEVKKALEDLIKYHPYTKTMKVEKRKVQLNYKQLLDLIRENEILEIQNNEFLTMILDHNRKCYGVVGS